jgi:Eco57I restriction-modification methylase
MNRTKLKNYAPQARWEFIQAVTDRAAYYGLTAKQSELITEKGDVALIAGKAFPRAVAQKRKALEERIARQGFEQTMEALAYTWFNRLVAIRFMELHGYLNHGYRVLSHPEGQGTPEILEHAEHVDLPGLDKNKVIDLKLDGSKEAELYRLLLIAQCNALHAAMPFLFERIDDETELLLPDNLLHSDSLIRKLVNEIDEEDWREVEIIGWLYQFYISEKKDQVIGKVVKSEDIPAATQLFTPNWIVKYLVQNSLGRQWLMTYPNSPLRQQMEYYIEPAEQTLEVQEQLKAITPESLNPEELTLLDPACGSGHILVEAYDLFKAIYQERGYRARDIPTLILRKNLFGLEIDDRAAQLAAFALMVKARADDRRIFSSGVQPNVVALQESKGLNAKELVKALNLPLTTKPLPPSDELAFMQDIRYPLFARERMGVKGDLVEEDIATLIELFADAKTFGSLIQVPPKLAEKLPAIGQRVRDVLSHGDLMMQPAAKALLPLVEQAWMLSWQYDCVVANPPYMGGKNLNLELKEFAKTQFFDSRANTFATFMVRGFEWGQAKGFNAMVTMESWMFLSSFEQMRRKLLQKYSLLSMVHMPYEGRGRTSMGINFGTSATIFAVSRVRGYKAHFCCVRHTDIDEDGVPVEFPVKNERLGYQVVDDFNQILGSPIVYWISEAVRRCFLEGTALGTICAPRKGNTTTDNARFLRLWFEVNFSKVGLNYLSAQSANLDKKKWLPYNKGGPFRRWYGCNEYLVNWENDGWEIKQIPHAVIANEKFFLQPGLTWTTVTSGKFSVREFGKGFIFDNGGCCIFLREDIKNYVNALLNSVVFHELFAKINPTLNFQSGEVAKFPILFPKVRSVRQRIEINASIAVELAKADWDSKETSWDFHQLPLLTGCTKSNSVELSYKHWNEKCLAAVKTLRDLEIQNNKFLIEAYGLQDELPSEVPEDQITLARPDREEDIKRLISYAIGCMMGRYCLDKPGLIYAHSGNKGFSPSQYTTFPADPDGIIPIMEVDWFPDDAANRFVEFISVAWPKEHLEENLQFIAESLGPNRDEQLRDTVRRYFATSFFKDHLKTYKRRPIYWLFSSGKQQAFQCLVYLHRYHEGTLSRMRTEYVIPLQGKIAARIDHLASDIAAATSTSHRKKSEKERDTLLKQQAELQAFDEKLRHYAVCVSALTLMMESRSTTANSAIFWPR